MSYVDLRLRLSLDDLDAAVERALYGKVDFARRELTKNSVSYRLPFGDDDSVGEIYVCGFADGQSELLIQSSPVPPPQMLSPEDLDRLHEIGAERLKRLQQKEERFAKIVEVFLNRLSGNVRLLETFQTEFQGLVVDCQSDSKALRQMTLQILSIDTLPAGEGGGEGETAGFSDAAKRLAQQYIGGDIKSDELLSELQKRGELPPLPAKLKDAKLDMLAEYADNGRWYFEEYYPQPQRVFQQELDRDKSTVERYVGAFRAICKIAGIEPESLKDHQ